MRILVIGGTKFLGRAFVETALERGHELTLFTRGQTNPGLFPDAEHVHGDRDGDLDALRGREWDAAVDTSGYVPRVVRQSAELLRDAVSQYVFVSSVSAYASYEGRPTEGDARAELEDPDTEDILPNYAGLKAACERVVEGSYGDRALIVRPGLIVGPHDPTGRFTYWPHRIARGGDVLAPEPRAKPVQYIDVRDLGDWMVRLVEECMSGIYNAAGPEPRPTMEELLDTCRRAFDPEARLVWVDAEFLREHEVGEWMELPLWVGVLEPVYSGLLNVDVSRAIAAGLTFRSIEETARATLAEAELTDAAGLKPEREQELLDAWAARSA
jgi:nucleoside-diphosphate-sugar epimerase